MLKKSKFHICFNVNIDILFISDSKWLYFILAIYNSSLSDILKI
jgi:hypothetical protein